MRVTGMRSIEQCRRAVQAAKDARQCDTAQPVRVPESTPRKSRLNGRDFFIALSPPGRIHAAPGGLHSSRRDTGTRSFLSQILRKSKMELSSGDRFVSALFSFVERRQS